jgi:hypothetical protein
MARFAYGFCSKNDIIVEKNSFPIRAFGKKSAFVPLNN